MITATAARNRTRAKFTPRRLVAPLSPDALLEVVNRNLDAIAAAIADADAGAQLILEDIGGTGTPTGPAGATDTLSATYAAGGSIADQTLYLLDTDGGTVIFDVTSALYTGLYAWQVNAAATTDTYRARFHHTVGTGSDAIIWTGYSTAEIGGALTAENMGSLGTRWLVSTTGNSSTKMHVELQKAPGTFGTAIDFLVGGFEVPTEASMGVSSGAATARLRYNGTNFQASYNAAAWVDLGGSGGISGSGAADRIAYWSSAPVLTYSSKLKFYSATGNVEFGDTPGTGTIAYRVFATADSSDATTSGGIASLRCGAVANDGGIWALYRARGSVATPTACSAGDTIGELTFAGFTDDWKGAAEIKVKCATGWGASGADSPGEMWFQTTPDGSATPTDRAVIDSTGDLCVGGLSLLGDRIRAQKNQNDYTYSAVVNTTSGTSGVAGFRADSPTNSTYLFSMSALFDYSGVDPRRPSGGSLEASGVGGLSITALDAAGDLRFYTGGYAAANKRYEIDQDGNNTWTQGVQTSGNPIGWIYTSGAHTGLAASSEVQAENHNHSATLTWLTGGTVTTQRSVVFVAPTLASAGSTTFGSAVGVDLGRAPSAGSGATITALHNVWYGSDVTHGASADGAIYACLYQKAHTVTYSGTTANPTGYLTGALLAGITITNTSDFRLGAASGMILGTPTTTVGASVTALYSLYAGGSCDGGEAAATSIYNVIRVPAHTWTLALDDIADPPSTLTTSPALAGIHISQLTMAATGITATYAASLYIAAAPTASAGTITNAYSIWVDAGVSRFDGEVDLGVASGTTGVLAFASSAAAHLTKFQAGTPTAAATYTLPVAAPTANGQPLLCATDGTMSWGTAGHMVVAKLTGDHTNATTTATEVTDLSKTLVAGTYVFKYWLIVKTDTTTTGIRFGVNYTGTASPFIVQMRTPSNGTTGTTIGDAPGVGVMDGQTAVYSRTETTTVPDMGVLAFEATNSNAPVFIEGTMVVSDGGDLELWHSSEAATTTTVVAGSCLVITRIA